METTLEVKFEIRFGALSENDAFSPPLIGGESSEPSAGASRDKTNESCSAACCSGTTWCPFLQEKSSRRSRLIRPISDSTPNVLHQILICSSRDNAALEVNTLHVLQLFSFEADILEASRRIAMCPKCSCVNRLQSNLITFSPRVCTSQWLHLAFPLVRFTQRALWDHTICVKKKLNASRPLSCLYSAVSWTRPDIVPLSSGFLIRLLVWLLWAEYVGVCREGRP